MAHDIQLTERANREQADMLLEALRIVLVSEGEPWQWAERERLVREDRAKLLGDE